jgi:hypothetical protein
MQQPQLGSSVTQCIDSFCLYGLLHICCIQNTNASSDKANSTAKADNSAAVKSSNTEDIDVLQWPWAETLTSFTDDNGEPIVKKLMPATDTTQVMLLTAFCYSIVIVCIADAIMSKCSNVACIHICSLNVYAGVSYMNQQSATLYCTYSHEYIHSHLHT